MNTWTFRWFSRSSATLLVIFLLSVSASAQFASAKRRPDPGPLPKDVHGTVLDKQGKPLVGAHVFITDLKTSIIRTLTTDATGTYQIRALAPVVDYDIYAEYKGKKSEKKLISGILNRQDNVINFQVDVEGGGSAGGAGPQFDTFDLVHLHASFDVPPGVPAPVPSVLLLHGFGENRAAWDALKQLLLQHGWAVMAVDLRGHGDSTAKDGVPFHAAETWRNSPDQFPLDVDPALDWLKSQPRIDNRKIVVIGDDIGANLALIASGRFPEVRTVVAINPRLSESLAMAGSPQDFSPRSALILTSDQAEGDSIRAVSRNPMKIVAVPLKGGTATWVGNKGVTDAIFQWLQQTY